ncbi:MAG: CDP-diacylglycerol--serine O-phosphatidyltransferase [Zetaproteobacteria bacterium]|nr:MAG: CDP-diacylglycerol--serine O-phosphatidyltransferase [Zetaproteobacteria bacterium]
MPRSRVRGISQKGVYILPSLFTSMGLFSGFYALIGAIQGRFELAGWAIIVAAIFDILDGRVARLLQAETAFGAEYDSLCDMLSFGIAPAVLMYLWALVHLPSELHKLAWLAAFGLAACAALRLARFNVQVGKHDKRYFQGLPTPASALLVATAVLFHEDVGIEPWPWLWFGVSLVLSWLMVSNVRFVSGKNVDLRQRQSVGIVVFMIIAIAFIMADPYRVPFMLVLTYCLHGPLISLWQSYRVTRYRLARRKVAARKKRVRETRTENTGEEGR